MDRPKAESSGFAQGDGLVTPPDFVSMIWTLLPIAPCGRMLVQALGAEAVVERFDIGVVGRLARSQEVQDDARRAGSAVHHTNLAISNMVLLAELAAVDGENLYDLEVGGKSLHTGIGYLLAVTQNPTLIAPYATETGTGMEGYSATRQDLRWATGGMAGWGLFHVARYPDHANTKLLKALSPQVAKRSSGIFEFAGGNASCLTAVAR